MIGLGALVEPIVANSPLPLGVTSYLLAVWPFLLLVLWNVFVLLRPWFNGNVHVFDNGLDSVGLFMGMGFAVFCGGVGAGLSIWPSTRYDSMWIGAIGVVIGVLVLQYSLSGLAWVNTDSRRVTVFGVVVPLRSWRFANIKAVRLLETRFRSKYGANMGSHWEATLLVGAKKKEVAIGTAGDKPLAEATLVKLRGLIKVG